MHHAVFINLNSFDSDIFCLQNSRVKNFQSTEPAGFLPRKAIIFALLPI
jgi:hypothetical protein